MISVLHAGEMTAGSARVFIFRWINVRLEQQGLNEGGNEFLILGCWLQGCRHTLGDQREASALCTSYLSLFAVNDLPANYEKPNESAGWNSAVKNEDKSRSDSIFCPDLRKPVSYKEVFCFFCIVPRCMLTSDSQTYITQQVWQNSCLQFFSPPP